MTQSRLTAIVAATLLCACPGGGPGPDPEPDAGSDPTPAFVHTTIIGTALDDADGAALAGVEISAYGKSTTTGSDGTFALEDLTVPAERCALVARKTGYFATGKAAVPVDAGVSRFRLRLVKKVAQPVAASGGSVSLADGSGVQFQASSFTKDGQAFTQTVQVAARHLDPTASSFGAQFPGDYAAVRQDGSGSMLVSYGVVQVEMEDELGEQVELASDLPATLTFPVPDSMKGQAPATIPLWYFDEDEGIWKEQGTATLDVDRYVGQVQHFSSWNSDQPEKTAWVTGTVTCGGKPIAGVSVTAGPSRGTTDETGHFKIPVPANTQVTVRIEEDGVVRSTVERQAGPIAPGDTESVGVLPLDSCPAHLKGRVIKQDGKPVSAQVRATWGSGGSDFQFAPGGSLSVAAPPDTDVTLEISVEGGEGATVTRRTPAASEEADLGDIVVAVAANCDFWDVDAKPYKIALSATGGLLAANVYNSGIVEIRDAASGAVKLSLDSGPGGGSFLQFSADGKRLLTSSIMGGSPKVWDADSGSVLRDFTTASIASSMLMPDGSSILGRTNTDELKQYAVSDGSELKTFAFNLTDPIEVMGLRGGGNEVLILRNAGNFSVTAWDLVSDKEARTFDIGRCSDMGSMQLWALDGDGSVVALQPYDSTAGSQGVFFWDTATGQKINAQGFFASATDTEAAKLAFKPDGTAFVTQPARGSSSYDPPTMYSFPAMAKLFTVPWPQYNRVDEYAFSADGRFLAMGQDDSLVRIVDVTSCH
ncbi:MAG TPA: hypothetical protein VGK67_13270 [Myxococcales bacterium]|jgi:hypothetical protein